MRLVKLISVAFVVGAIVASSIVAQASTLSVQFNCAPGFGTAAPLAPTDSTGVVNVANWNALAMNATNNGASPVTGLKDSTGATTAASINFNMSPGAYPTWNNATPTDTAIGKLFHSRDDGWAPSATHWFTVSNIPYATYDVYAYYFNDIQNNGSTGTGWREAIDLNGGTQYLVVRGALAPATSFTPWTSADYGTYPSGNAGNYIVWSGQQGSSLTINASATGPAAGGSIFGLSGIQIVDTTVPEPGTLVLLAAGLIGLLAYAWRKRR